MSTAGISMGAMSFSASSYGRIIGGNARVNIGIVGFSDRAKGALIPAMFGHANWNLQLFPIYGTDEGMKV